MRNKSQTANQAMLLKNTFLTSFSLFPRLILLALVTFTYNHYAQAEQITENTPIRADSPIDTNRIKTWIASQEAFARWGEQHNEALSTPNNEALPNPSTNSERDSDNPLAISAEQMLRPLKQAKLYGSAERMIQASGFATLKDWADYTLRITQAAMAVQIEASGSIGNNAELEQLLREDQLSARDRAMLEAGIAQNQAIERYLNDQVSSSDKAAIEPLLPMLEQFIEGF